MTLPDDLFYVWARDDIDSSDFEDTDEPRPLYVCMQYPSTARFAAA